MKEFEKDMQTMIESIKFRSFQNKFQKKLKEDLKLINSSKNIFLSADKTQNFYEITKKDYEKIIHENVTKKYKKALCLCQKGVLTEKQEKLQKPLMSLVEFIALQNKSAK